MRRADRRQRPRVVLLVNHGANKGRAAIQTPRIHRYFREAGVQVQIIAKNSPDAALAAVRDALNDPKKPRPAALAVAGGDGAVHLALQAVAGTDMVLGVIPLGSGNDIARDLGLAEASRREAVAAIVEALDIAAPQHRVRSNATTGVTTTGVAGEDGTRRVTARGRGDRVLGARGAAERAEEPMCGVVRKLDAMRVTATQADGSSRTRWALAIVSAGIDATVNKRTNDMSWPPGRLRYLRALGKQLGSLQPYGYRLSIDGEAQELPAIVVAVANMRHFGGGMRVAPGAKQDDGLLDVVVVDPVRTATLVHVFPRIYRGTHVTHPAVTIRRAQEVAIAHAPRSGREPEVIMADGEEQGRVPALVRVAPGAVSVVARTVMA